MWFKILGGLFLCVLALGYFGIWSAPAIVLGILSLGAGVALLAGK